MNRDGRHSILAGKGAVASAPGPVAVIFAEDSVELDSTLAHHENLGFRTLLLIGESPFADIEERPGLHVLHEPITGARDAASALNRLVPALAGKWVYWCFNAEYLFFPFCETRTIRDVLSFVESERREAVFTYTIDLYADDLGRYPDAVSPENAYLDRSGYYGTTRRTGDTWHEREIEVFGGLRWRFDEHVPADRRRIDRISLFKAAKGREIGADFRLNESELNTISCPWHNNLTMAVVSFRTAKSLKLNPGSAYDIDSFMWSRSGRFNWSSAQLMKLGFMEPGQWF
ncbi:MAG: hypothetical protein ACE5FS_00410 [Paracoccaceae bacterium]